MSKTNGNDPIGYVPGVTDVHGPNYGLTKRELFAAMILQGMMAGGSNIHAHSENASNAVFHADALIKALSNSDVSDSDGAAK